MVRWLLNVSLHHPKLLRSECADNLSQNLLAPCLSRAISRDERDKGEGVVLPCWRPERLAEASGAGVIVIPAKAGIQKKYDTGLSDRARQ